MGCSSSQEGGPVHDVDASVLGRCWATTHKDGNRVESHWIPNDSNDNGQRPNYAFTLAGGGSGSSGGAVHYARSSFLQKYRLGVRHGLDVKEINSTAMDAVSSDTILQSTERGLGGNVAVSGTMISLGAEFSKVRSAGPGRRSMFLVVVAKMFELELVPSQAKERGYVQHEVDVDVSKKSVRDQYGEGIITQVLYGGYLVIDIEQENFAALRDGFVAMGKVGASPAGGGEVGARFAKSKTEGAKAFNSSVRRVGGDSKLVPPSFTNAPIEKVLTTIEKWIKDLRKFPHKAAPISLYLQTYSGIIRHIKRHPKNFLDDAKDEVDKRLLQEQRTAGGPAYVAPYNKFYNGPVASPSGEFTVQHGRSQTTGGVIGGGEQWTTPPQPLGGVHHHHQHHPHHNQTPLVGVAPATPADLAASPLGYTYPLPPGAAAAVVPHPPHSMQHPSSASHLSSGGSDIAPYVSQHHHQHLSVVAHHSPSQSNHGLHIDTAAISAPPPRDYGEQSLKTPTSHDDLHSPNISPPHVETTPNPKPLEPPVGTSMSSFHTPTPAMMEPLDGHTQPPKQIQNNNGASLLVDPLGYPLHAHPHSSHPPPLQLGGGSSEHHHNSHINASHHQTLISGNVTISSLVSSNGGDGPLLGGSFDGASPQQRQQTRDFSETLDEPTSSSMLLAEYTDKTSTEDHDASVVIPDGVAASANGHHQSAKHQHAEAREHVDPTVGGSANGSPLNMRRGPRLAGEGDINSSDANEALITFGVVPSSLVSGSSSPFDSTHSSPVVANPTKSGVPIHSDSSSDVPSNAPASTIEDILSMRPSRSIAQRLEDNEALWHITNKELSAMRRELAEHHAVTEELQAESDKLEANIRTLRYTYFPDLDANAVDGTLDFLEYYLNDLDSLPESEKDLDNAASWLPCAAVLLQHPRSRADVLSIHANLNDDDAHVLAGFIRGGSNVVCRTCAHVNLANNELRSQGAASILRACIECAAATADANAGNNGTTSSSSSSSMHCLTKVDLAGNFLQSSFGAHVPEYTDAVRTIKETYSSKLKLLRVE